MKLSTRYAYLRRDARTLTVMLELATTKIRELARQIDPKTPESAGERAAPYTASDLRGFVSECASILHVAGVEPGRPVAAKWKRRWARNGARRS
jgi:hypothetical protein